MQRLRPFVGATTALFQIFREWQLAALLGGLLVFFTLAAQVPRTYSVPIGRADGPGSDLPLVSGYYDAERDPRGSFRWTSARSSVELPGTGQRSLQVTLRVLTLGDDIAPRAPKVLELWSRGRLIATFAVQKNGAIYHFIVPAPADNSGDQQIELRSATFDAGDPPRALGVPVDGIQATGDGLALPAWRSTLVWLLAALVLWLALRHAGFAARTTLTLCAPLTALLGLAAALDPPRTAMGAAPALLALTLGVLLVAALRVGAPTLAARFYVPLDQRALRWLLLLVLVVFAMRYGGKTYPFSMEGDIGFHTNRFADVVAGKVMLLSKNRGVYFPYPPALYLLLAPWTLLGIARPELLHLFAAVMDALSPLLVYAIATVFIGHGARSQEPGARSQEPGARRRTTSPRHLVILSSCHSFWPVVAAGIYSLSASGFMTTWWNFSTHIFTQFAHLLLSAVVVLWWTNNDRIRNQEGGVRSQKLPARQVPVIAILFTLQMLVYLGHYGFWVNTTLLGGIGFVALLARRCWDAKAKIVVVSFIAAELAATALFYSGYAGLLVGQVQAAATGGLTGLAGREAAPLDVLWDTLWDAGLRVHFGFFPVPLAFAGLLLVRDRWQQDRVNRQSSIVAVLIGGTFLIGLAFAVLPFASGSTLTTRWLMFSAWAIAVAAALAMQVLWRTGRAGQLVVVAVCSYVVWIMSSQWLVAMIWRVRPPEPF